MCIRHYLKTFSLSSIYSFGMNGASHSRLSVRRHIRMRCRAQNCIDANVIQLSGDFATKNLSVRTGWI